ncbi:MAG TPA: DNA primase [Pirellulaceae bacterium]|nr:DNA primase [Pirellulaceae bacterium]
MPLFPQDDTKDRIRAAVDITDLVGAYGLELRRQGRNYVCLCPWHADSRPSLNVNPERQTWKCWVCNIGGDIFSFVMQREGIDFRQAMEMLAERAGIELTQRPQAKAQPGSASDKNTLYKALEWAEQQFHDCFLRSSDAAAARKYIHERGIDAEHVKKFRIGYSPDNWQWLIDRAAQTPYTPAVLDAAGLINKRESGGAYDFFRGRVIFPIRDTQLRPIAFGARILPEVSAEMEARTGNKPGKYINTRETRLFSKSEQLYGLDIGRDAIAKSREIVITEGYTDVIIPHQFGVQNIAAVLGTALGARHIPLVRRFADTVYLVLDGDEAGQRRTNEIIQLFLFENLGLRILTLPNDLDPCDFVLEYGGEAFQGMLPSASDGFDHKVRAETAGIDVIRDTLRANLALENLLALIAEAPRPASSATEFIRLREQQYLTRLGREFQLADKDLRARLEELRKLKKPGTTPANAEAITSNHPRASDLNKCECELLEILTQHADLGEKAEMEIPVDAIESHAARAIYGTYCQIARAGELPEFGRVLAAIEDVGLKSLLVELDERAGAKAAHATEDGFAQLATVVRAMRDRQQLPERRAQLAELEVGRKTPEDQMSSFRNLISGKLNQQMQLPGFRELKKESDSSLPTDG